MNFEEKKPDGKEVENVEYNPDKLRESEAESVHDSMNREIGNIRNQSKIFSSDAIEQDIRSFGEGLPEDEVAAVVQAHQSEIQSVNATFQDIVRSTKESVGEVFGYDTRKEVIHEEITPDSKNEPKNLHETSDVNDEFSEDPKEEAYDFSKEFSKRGREEMAQQIQRLRHEYMSDFVSEKKKRAEVVSAKDHYLETKGQEIEQMKQFISDTETKKNEWLVAQEELKNIKDGIEKKKSSSWYKIQRMVGGGIEVHEKENEYDKKKNETGSFNEEDLLWAESSLKNIELSRDDRIKAYEQQIAEIKNVVIDEAWHDKTRAMVNEFYRGQNEIKNDWEKDAVDRDIRKNTVEHNVLFLHGIPFEGPMADTFMNNPLMYTKGEEGMSPEDKSMFLAGIEPTISVSSKIIDENNPEKIPVHELMYTTGLIIGDGKIMSASGTDAGTLAENFDIRSSKDALSSIQPDIAKNIKKAINGNTVDRGWNEFVVQNPKISGIYIMEGAENEEAIIPRIQKLANEMHVPVIRVSRDGKMFDIAEGKETTKEEVLANTAKFSTEEKINLIERTKKFVGGLHPELSEEIQKRLDTLKAEENV